MKIQHKRSATAVGGKAKEPTAAQTERGELCINFSREDPALFIKDVDENIIRVGGDLSLYQKIEDVPSATVVCSPSEIDTLSPPDTRGEGSLWWNTEDGILYVWYEDADSSQWVITVPQGGGAGGDVPPGTTVGTAPPLNPEVGQLWWNSDDTENGGGRLYVYYNDGDSAQWVDTSVPGGKGSYITESDARALFLSSTEDDTAAGKITFEDITTHKNGVSVTGGDAATVLRGLSSGNANRLSINAPQDINFVIDGIAQAGVDTTGRFIARSNNSTVRGTTLVGGYSKSIYNYMTDGNYGSNPGETIDGNTAAVSYATSMGSTADIGAAVGYFARIADVGPGNIATAYGFYSELQDASTLTNVDEAYNFYAAGDAPNYFAGATLFGSVNTSMANDAGTENGWVFSPAGRASSHCTLATVNDNNASFKMWKHDSRTGRFISFHYSNAIGNGGDSVCGYIVQTSANSVEYEKTSDYRLKENIVDLPNATERVKAIKPYQYNFKNEPGVIHEGFVAHELQEHTVLAVSGEKDATEVFGTYTDVDGNVETNVTEPATIPAGSTFEPQGTRDVYQGVAPSALIPLLTKALQEVIAKNEDLETRLAALEGA